MMYPVPRTYVAAIGLISLRGQPEGQRPKAPRARRLVGTRLRDAQS